MRKPISRIVDSAGRWWFDIATGDGYLYESRSFEAIDRQVAERIAF
jgi:hypothetical protein